MTLPFTSETPTESELRIAQAQLVGWLEGLFHGIQATLFTQQAVAQSQFDEMRQRRAIEGGPGDDIQLIGMGGDDRISSGAGADTAFGGPGDDDITGGQGTDTLWGNFGSDVIATEGAKMRHPDPKHGRPIASSISFATAPVQPEPAKITATESSPPTQSRMISRASSRSRVVCSPVPDDSVWVLAYRGSTSSRR